MGRIFGYQDRGISSGGRALRFAVGGIVLAALVATAAFGGEQGPEPGAPAVAR